MNTTPASPMTGPTYLELRAAFDGCNWTHRIYTAGQTIAPAGERPGKVYLLEHGWASADRALINGRRQIVDFVLPGDLVAPAMSAPLRESIRAITKVRALEAQPLDFHRVVSTPGPANAAFLGSIERQLAIRTEHLIGNRARSASARMAHLFLELLERTKGMENDLGWPLPQSDIADALGLTPVHVSRVLASLRRSKLVNYRYGKLEVLDRPRLTRLAEFDSGYLANTRSAEHPF